MLKVCPQFSVFFLIFLEIQIIANDKTTEIQSCSWKPTFDLCYNAAFLQNLFVY